MIHLDWLGGYLAKQGFSVKWEDSEFLAAGCIRAEADTRNGIMTVYATAEGARIGKPNGSHKYYYGVSDAKLAHYVQQVIASNGGKVEA